MFIFTFGIFRIWLIASHLLEQVESFFSYFDNKHKLNMSIARNLEDKFDKHALVVKMQLHRILIMDVC